MRRFVTRFSIFAGLQAVVLALVLAGYRPSPRHYMAGTIDKHRLLESTPSPRLIAAGGSNLPMGIECDSLARRIPLRPIDMGLHAGLGIGFEIGELHGQLRRGDVVLLSIEFESFAAATQPEILYRVIAAHPASLAYVPLEAYPRLLDYGLTYIGIMVRRNVDRLRGRQEQLDLPYVREAFNAYGDDTVRTVALRYLPAQVSPAELQLFPEGRVPDHFMSSIRLLNRFHSECTRKGVHVYFTHAVIPETRWHLWHSEFATADSLLARHLTIPRLEPLEDVVVPDSWCFDTAYHLTREGVAARSQTLASRFAARLATDAVIDRGAMTLR